MYRSKHILGFIIIVITFSALVVYMAGCEQQKAKNEAIKAQTRQVIEEAWNKGNLDILDEYYSPDYVYHRTPFPDIKGLDAYKQYIRDNRSSYPDVKLSVKDVVVEGDMVVIRGTYQGTQTGPSPTLGITTGKKVDFEWCSVSRRVNGKTVEDNQYVDWLGFMQQIGYKITPPLTETSFARVTLTQGKAEMMDETIKIYKESVVPAAQSQNGYRGAYLLSDSKTGKGISITLWDSEADAVANEQSGYYREQVDKFKDFLTAKPIREGYKVTVQD